MASHSLRTAHTVIGIIGDLLTLGLFLAPAPTVWRILQSKSSQQFHPYTHIFGVMNCMVWILYAVVPFVRPGSFLVLPINAFGLALQLAYLIIFFIYTQEKYRIHIGAFLLVESIVFVIVAVLTLKIIHTHQLRTMVVGIICGVFGAIMYISPLWIMRRVIQTQSVEFLPLWPSVAVFSNGIVWTVYALLHFDLYILISNGVGAISGLVQLILYACYCNSAPADDGRNRKVKDDDNLSA